jgi:hypothetical protein
VQPAELLLSRPTFREAKAWQLLDYIVETTSNYDKTALIHHVVVSIPAASDQVIQLGEDLRTQS